MRQEQYCRDTQYHKPHPRGLIIKSWLGKQVGFVFLRLLFRAQHGNRGGGSPPGKARHHQGCTGWALSLRSPGTTAAPRSTRLSQSHWCPAGRGRAPAGQHTAVPPRIPHPEETGGKEVVRADCGHTQPGTCSFIRAVDPDPLPRPKFASVLLHIPQGPARTACLSSYKDCFAEKFISASNQLPFYIKCPSPGMQCLMANVLFK